MNDTQTIVIRRTNIEHYEDEDGVPDSITLSLLVYLPGHEGDTLAQDEESWELFHATGEWTNVTRVSAEDGFPTGLWYYLGLHNQALLKSVLNALVEHEYLTITYSIQLNIQEGHSLPTCSTCQHWKDGVCKKVNQDIPGDHIIPCDKLFKAK